MPKRIVSAVGANRKLFKDLLKEKAKHFHDMKRDT
jgi:hypothetical protein